MKHLLLLLIMFGMIGLSRTTAQDSLKTKYILLQKMKEYSTYPSMVEENKTDQQKSRQTSKENEQLKYQSLHAATTNNKLKLSVANNMNRSFEEIIVKITNLPSWISTDIKQKTIRLPANAQTDLFFSFDIASGVSVGQKGKLTLEATGDASYNWSKKIAVKVTSPGRFELMPNYPNPFNPSTTIQYNLPARMEVTVKIYNMLGRRVATLADKVQEAGRHELRWDASNMASGLYFYQVIAENSDGKQIVENRKMMLIK